jgi:hypothetical protein
MEKGCKLSTRWREEINRAPLTRPMAKLRNTGHFVIPALPWCWCPHSGQSRQSNGGLQRLQACKLLGNCISDRLTGGSTLPSRRGTIPDSNPVLDFNRLMVCG